MFYATPQVIRRHDTKLKAVKADARLADVGAR